MSTVGPVGADRWLVFFAVVVIVQGVHVFEHIVQLIQVFVLGVPDDDALGLLGYVFEFQGTEEWLHLVFNLAYLSGIYVLVVPMRRWARRVVPIEAVVAFVVLAVALQSWHGVEHLVIIRNVLAAGGCPCPGVLDVALGTTDTILHFFYNGVTYAGLVIPFAFVLRRHLMLRRAAGPGSERAAGSRLPAPG